MSLYGFEIFNTRFTASRSDEYRSSGSHNGRRIDLRNKAGLPVLVSVKRLLFHGTPKNDFTTKSEHLKFRAVSMENMYSDLLPNPNPTFQALDVVTACMDTLVQNRHDTKIGLDVCFAFSNDRCRAAIGGNINEFYQYATNPTFAYLTSSVSYRIVSIGPIINGTAHRGSMQTVLMEVIPSITTSMKTTTIRTIRAVPSSSSAAASPSLPPPPSPNVKDAAINRLSIDATDNNTSLDQKTTPTSTPRRFLWTLQQERRPPLQNCWMIHEVLYTKNAFQQTM